GHRRHPVGPRGRACTGGGRGSRGRRRDVRHAHTVHTRSSGLLERLSGGGRRLPGPGTRRGCTGTGGMGTAAATAGTVSEVPSNVPDALLLDEMFSPAIATYLAARGIDCRA